LARKTHKKERKKEDSKQKCEGEDERQELKINCARDVTTASDKESRVKMVGEKRFFVVRRLIAFEPY